MYTFSSNLENFSDKNTDTMRQILDTVGEGLRALPLFTVWASPTLHHNKKADIESAPMLLV